MTIRVFPKYFSKEEIQSRDWCHSDEVVGLSHSIHFWQCNSNYTWKNMEVQSLQMTNDQVMICPVMELHLLAEVISTLTKIIFPMRMHCGI